MALTGSGCCTVDAIILLACPLFYGDLHPYFQKKKKVGTLCRTETETQCNNW